MLKKKFGPVFNVDGFLVFLFTAHNKCSAKHFKLHNSDEIKSLQSINRLLINTIFLNIRARPNNCLSFT